MKFRPYQSQMLRVSNSRYHHFFRTLLSEISDQHLTIGWGQHTEGETVTSHVMMLGGCSVIKSSQMLLKTRLEEYRDKPLN